MERKDNDLRNNKNLERKSKIVSSIIGKLPAVAVSIITIWLFFYLVTIKSEKGIQATDWFEISGAVFLFLGITQILMDMIGIPLGHNSVESQEKRKRWLKLFSFPGSVVAGVVLIFLSMILPKLLTFIS